MVSHFSRTYLALGSTAQPIPEYSWNLGLCREALEDHETKKDLMVEFKVKVAMGDSTASLIDTDFSERENHRILRCICLLGIIAILLPMDFKDDQLPGSPLHAFWSELPPWENTCVREFADISTIFNKNRASKRTKFGIPSGPRPWIQTEPCGRLPYVEMFRIRRSTTLHPSIDYRDDDGPVSLWFLQLLAKKGIITDSILRRRFMFDPAALRPPQGFHLFKSCLPILDQWRLEKLSQGTMRSFRDMALHVWTGEHILGSD